MSSWTDYPDELDVDIVLRIDRTGVFRRGRLSGPPEDCYPDEYEDFRVLVGVEINGRDVPRGDVPPSVWEWFEAMANEAEMDPPEEER
jgi:hypothetical protein